MNHGSYKKMLRESIHESQKCQRNWDLTKPMDPDDEDLIVEAAKNAPSKQNLNYYKMKVIKNREVIEKIHNRTKGFGPIYTSYDPEIPESGSYSPETDEGQFYTNSQVMANMVIAFCKDEPTLVREENDDYSQDRDMAIGIAAGYVNVIATQLGYATGCCKCFDDKEIGEILGDKPILLMGVGHPDKTKNRRQHHTEDFKFPTLKKYKKIDTQYV
tara:strand:- start:1178 stop:1822 length:645 start_codon:yes stop_codon:yes gene_type:complete